MLNKNPKNSQEQGSEEYVFCPYVIRNGRKVYPKNAKFFRFLRPKK